MYYSCEFVSMSAYSVISLSDCAAVSSSSEDIKRRRHLMVSLYRRAGLLIWQKILHGIPEMRKTLGSNNRLFPRLWACCGEFTLESKVRVENYGCALCGMLLNDSDQITLYSNPTLCLAKQSTSLLPECKPPIVIINCNVYLTTIILRCRAISLRKYR